MQATALGITRDPNPTVPQFPPGVDGTIGSTLDGSAAEDAPQRSASQSHSMHRGHSMHGGHSMHSRGDNDENVVPLDDNATVSNDNNDNDNIHKLGDSGFIIDGDDNDDDHDDDDAGRGVEYMQHAPHKQQQHQEEQQQHKEAYTLVMLCVRCMLDTIPPTPAASQQQQGDDVVDQAVC